MKKISTTQISTEDLLSALNNVENVNTVYTSNDLYYTFLEIFNITSGTNRIPTKLINSLYRKWNPRDRNYNKTITDNISKFVECSRINSRNYYIINKTVNDIVKYFNAYEKPPVRERVKSKGLQKHFNKFLEATSIQRGKLFIESDVFYHVYDTWCYRNHKKTTLSYRRFISISELFFEHKHFEGSDLIWFGVDPSIKQHISAQGVRNWREGRTRRGKISKVKEENIIYPDTEKE